MGWVSKLGVFNSISVLNRYFSSRLNWKLICQAGATWMQVSTQQIDSASLFEFPCLFQSFHRLTTRLPEYSRRIPVAATPPRRRYSKLIHGRCQLIDKSGRGPYSAICVVVPHNKVVFSLRVDGSHPKKQVPVPHHPHSAFVA